MLLKELLYELNMKKMDGSNLRILKADHGDAFIFKAQRGDEKFVMVIDGGPRSANRVVLPELEKLIEHGEIDLMVLTHFDHDHIHGIIQFLADHKDKVGRIRKFWLNLPERIQLPASSPEITYEEARDLRNFMENLEKETGSTIDWKDRIITGMVLDDPKITKGLVKITVLAPTDEAIRMNEKCFRKKVEEPVKELTGEREDQTVKPLEELWKKEWHDKSLLNNASIAFLIEAFDGRKFLMCGDGNPDTIEKSLRSMKDDRENLYDENNPLKVDLFKLPHHGSRYNMRNTLLDIVDGDCYLISTNGGFGKSKHPDRETIAKLLFHPNRNCEKECRIFFNYDLDKIRKHAGDFLKDEEIKENKYNFNIQENVEFL